VAWRGVALKCRVRLRGILVRCTMTMLNELVDVGRDDIRIDIYNAPIMNSKMLWK
jgi:hypothetical protein